MKTIKLMIAASITVIVGLVLTAWLAEPISNYFRSDRIEAQLTVGPWVQMPAIKNRSGEKIKPVLGSDSAVLSIADASDVDENYRTKPTNFSELSIVNKSEKEISNIRIRFDSKQYRIIFQKDGDNKSTLIDDIDRIDLPNMKPGDKMTVQSWGNYYGSPERFADNLTTYSSTGSFRMTANWSGDQKIDEGPVIEFMNEWGGFIFGTIFVFLTIIGFILQSLTDDKLKKILADEATYKSEKSRYEKDPKKYISIGESQHSDINKP